jgi:anti-sigma-K factor RskA
VITEQTEEEASLYVLGLLPEFEALKFEAAMASDPELAALVAHLETAAAALASTVPPRDPPPALRARLAERIRQSDTELSNLVVPFPNLWSWVPWALAACLAVMAATVTYDRYHLYLLVDSFLQRDRRQVHDLYDLYSDRLSLQNQLAKAIAQQTADTQELTALRARVADLTARGALSDIKIATLASMLKNAPEAMAVVAWDSKSQSGILQPLHMPRVRPDQDYQLWIIDPDYKTPVSAGIFDPAKPANFEPLHPISKADKFAISLEKKGGSPSPLGPIVLIGE